MLKRSKMRGGLGRTLLTAFLLLTLGPLSVMSVFAIQRTAAVERELTQTQVVLAAENIRLQSVAEGVAATVDPVAALPQAWLYVMEEGAIRTLNTATLPLPTEVQTIVTASTADYGEIPATSALAGALWARVQVNPTQQVVVLLPQAGQNAAPDSLAATLVATALVVALVTTVAAAFITRQITRPLYELTQSAVTIAQGDVGRRAHVAQENELGILALAFNAMTDQLQESLQTLEQKVEERTEQLRLANAEIAHRAWQLEVGAEIGKALNAFHDLASLLQSACRHIQEDYDFVGVSVWLVGRRHRQRELTLRATSPAEATQSHAPYRDFALTTLTHAQGALLPDQCTLALPLRIADNAIGVLLVQSESPLSTDDQRPLQIVADTLAVAIENARAAEVEHEALLKLKQLGVHRSESLGAMSHELSTSLNTIIGYSSLLLRENSGPLNEMQRSDLSYINRNGVQLLTLLDGMLELIDESANGDEPPPSGT